MTDMEKLGFVVTRKPKQPVRIDSNDGWNNSGITIEYIKSKDKLRISGWYDGFVGIEGFTISGNELKQILGWEE